MSVNRTFTIRGHFEYELEMPRSWPDSAVYELRIQFVDRDDSVVFVHPEYAPVLYDRRKEEYRRVTFDMHNGNIRELQ